LMTKILAVVLYLIGAVGGSIAIGQNVSQAASDVIVGILFGAFIAVVVGLSAATVAHYGSLRERRTRVEHHHYLHAPSSVIDAEYRELPAAQELEVRR